MLTDRVPAATEGVDMMAAAGSGPATLPPGASGSDPPPVAPQKPLPFDCCESGCERCVYAIYADELEHYQSLLAAWHARIGDRLSVLRAGGTSQWPGVDPPA